MTVYWMYHLNRVMNFLLPDCLLTSMTYCKYIGVGNFIFPNSAFILWMFPWVRERVSLLLPCESLAHGAGSNPIWSRRDMFHCSDTTQTQGLFLLARIQLCLRSVCAVSRWFVYVPSHLLVSPVAECRGLWESEGFLRCLPRGEQRAESQEPAWATYTDLSARGRNHRFSFSLSKL